jgi:Uma2 family endonuclease
MAVVEVKYTYQDLRSTPDDGKRYELFEGDIIVSPSPTTLHQSTVLNIAMIVGSFVRENDRGNVFIASCDVYFSDDTVVEPDLLVVARDRLSIVKDDYIEGAPDLVVEVLSPTSEERDRGYKFKLYAEQGVKEYWLADYRKRVLQIFGLTSSGFQLLGEFKDDVVVKSSLFPELRFGVSELWK